MAKKKISKSRVEAVKNKKRVIKRKKFKIIYKKILLIVSSFILIIIGIYLLTTIRIKTITIKGNILLTDQEIIDAAGLKSYPSTLKNSSIKIEKVLKKDVYIENANVSKRNFFTRIIITVDENNPIFYYQPIKKVVLENGDTVIDNHNVPVVINQIPDSIYEKFLKKMAKVPKSVLDKMSEIKYTPTDVDAELFLITMNDSNYVYVNISKFERIYNYLEYVEGFNFKKGILHLDSGDYLEVLEGN